MKTALAERTPRGIPKDISPEESRLWHALQDVTDPEYPMSIIEMGLIYGLRKEGSTAHVNLTFTAMGCPCMEFIVSDIRERLLQEADVDNVEIEIVWDPPWTRKRLTAKGIEKLKSWGVSA